MPLAPEGADGTFLIMNGPNDTVTPSQFKSRFRDRVLTGQEDFRLAGPGYFATMQIPVLRGRAFTDADAPGSHPVAVISQSLADEK